MDSNSNCEDWESQIMHKKILNKIEFENNPILFLLMFCDSIQDEGRVTSSDKRISSDRSALENIGIENKDGMTKILINLSSHEKDKKEEEIERLAWCLQDKRFTISINDDTPKIMNGKGG